MASIQLPSPSPQPLASTDTLLGFFDQGHHEKVIEMENHHLARVNITGWPLHRYLGVENDSLP
jgi:hypothetical protein